MFTTWEDLLWRSCLDEYFSRDGAENATQSVQKG